MAERLKLIVLDDDPTGSQTVHSCPLLLRWDANTLRRGLAHPSPLLFVLANTRALDQEAARQRVREICQALKPLLAEAVAAGQWERWMLVCRGDSTLRSQLIYSFWKVCGQGMEADLAVKGMEAGFAV